MLVFTDGVQKVLISIPLHGLVYCIQRTLIHSSSYIQGNVLQVQGQRPLPK